MEFHFVGIKNGGLATILDSNANPRFICFKERGIAKTYTTYLCEHKSRFGMWPTVNLSTPHVELHVRDNKETMSSDYYRDLLEIKEKVLTDIDKLSIMTGISYFYCHTFGYEDLMSISLSGQDMDGEADDFMYREHLDYSLKNM